MADSNPTRELAAIMFSDIAGYTAIMGRDEQQAMRALDAHRGTLRTLLPKFNGRLIGEIGDGTLSSFHSAIDAVNCAREVQALAENAPELKLRIGIHLGDVVFTNNTVLGDGVNVASRIHALAPPGGICVSEHIYDAIRNKPGVYARDLGRKHLKNVARPIRVYALATSPAAAGISAERASGWRAAAAGAIGVLVVAAAVYAIVRRSPAGSAPAEQSAAAPHAIRSIAVLPLDNFSGDPKQEYFADGMTDELTTDLASISALRVISRTSVMQFKGEHRPPMPQIAAALKVDAVIEGSVIRSGDRVRITAQLIDAPNDRHLWAKSFERDSKDVLELQDELASAIAREVRVQLTPTEQVRLSGGRTVSPEAHDEYLKGRYYLNKWTEHGFRSAIDYFGRAIKADPTFAAAHAALASSYMDASDWYISSLEAAPKARDAANKALELDDTNSEAHMALAIAKYEYDFDWAGAEGEFQRAIALNPSFAEAHHQYGWELGYMGRFEAAATEMRQARETDPLSVVIASDQIIPMVVGWKADDAAAEAQAAEEVDPKSYLPRLNLGVFYLVSGRYPEAVTELERAWKLETMPWTAGYLGYAYAKSGQRDQALALIGELDKLSKQRFVEPFNAGYIYLGLGDNERALALLEKAYELRSAIWLPWLKVDRAFDPLRPDPRFQAIYKKVGLPP